MSKKVVESLHVVFSNTYTLLFMAQRFHWHVIGRNFPELHAFFEANYTDLFTKADDVAERIVTVGGHVPYELKDVYSQATLSKPKTALKDSKDMLEALEKGYVELIESAKKCIEVAREDSDIGTETLISDQIVALEKKLWMVRSAGA